MSGETFAWAAIAPDWASPPNFIHEGSVRLTRQEALEYIGSAWVRPGSNDWRDGWRRAYRRGWRCERVVIRRWGRLALDQDRQDGRGR